jgi:hypothetical protein
MCHGCFSGRYPIAVAAGHVNDDLVDSENDSGQHLVTD